MTLLELSELYAESARRIRRRILELRRAALLEPEAEAAWHLRQRAAMLEPMAREAQELAILTAHYYDRRYHNNEKYTL